MLDAVGAAGVANVVTEGEISQADVTELLATVALTLNT